MAADALAAEGLAFLQRLTGSREGCFFEPRTLSVDVSVCCHCAHSLELAQGEHVMLSASVKSMDRRDAERTAPLGAAIHLNAVDLDATLLLQAWATRASTPPRAVDPSEMRACGEVRVPMSRLAYHCGGMLYRTWLTLDSPGLLDSVASIGLLSNTDDGAEFDQKLVDGPRQLFQPKLCLSICKTADLTPSGKLVFTKDASHEARVVQWGPLLRSQQQHAILSAALHLQRSQVGEQRTADRQALLVQHCQKLYDRAGSRALAIAELEAEVHGMVGHGLPDASTARLLAETQPQKPELFMPALGDIQRRLSQGLQALKGRLSESAEAKSAMSPRLEEMRGSNARREAQIQALRGELARLREEASRKVDAANDRIVALRTECDEARREGARIQQEAMRLSREREELSREQRQLNEQKDALLRIVEDLHQTCLVAGLQNVGRGSIDSVTMNFGLS
mmetsp:Transcript_95620/g.270581  ORF Transcript_95620/g.270581 Transcript_95620/m.270581 type:complete len:452 (-) Transcript_95620:115-1470(-)